MFRRNSDGSFYALWVTSDKVWNLQLRRDGVNYLIGHGFVPSLNTSPDGSNELKLVVRDTRGLLSLNGQFVSNLDVSDYSDPGQLLVLAGFSDKILPGSTTHFSSSSASELSADTLNNSPRETPSPSPPSDYGTIVARSGVNLRSGAGTQFATIGTVKSGDLVSILGQNANGEWLHIRTQDRPDVDKC